MTDTLDRQTAEERFRAVFSHPGRRAYDELSALLAHNVLEAPAGAREGWTPTPLPTVPFVVFAHDGGLDWIRASYEQVAAGDPRNLISSCRANAPE